MVIEKRLSIFFLINSSKDFFLASLTAIFLLLTSFEVPFCLRFKRKYKANTDIFLPGKIEKFLPINMRFALCDNEAASLGLATG